MKKFKKVLTMVLAFALVICLTVAATVAYLTDKTAVAKNTFTMGKVDIVLSENVVDETGKKTSDRTEAGNTAIVTGNDNQKYGYALMPGRQVDKDPMVTVVTGSEECYVRMKVTLDNADKFIQVFKAHKEGGSDVESAIGMMQDYFVGYNSAKWTFAGATLEDNKVTVTFNYAEKVTKTTETATAVTTKESGAVTGKNLEPIITAVKLPEWVTSEDAALLPNFAVTVIAEAIQAEGFDTADAAWTAFDGQTNAVTGTGLNP